MTAPSANGSEQKRSAIGPNCGPGLTNSIREFSRRTGFYGGKNRGWSLRYKKTKAFTTLVPEYRRFSAVVVMGGAEREKFEERRYVWRPQLVKLYDEAKTYIDGKWLTLTISSADDLHDVTELLTMKRPPLPRS